jgi:methionyl-tRNA formyltransferase
MMASVASIVFLGTSAFAVPSLRALASEAGCNITLVVTQPDRPVGRKQTLTPSPVKLAAEELRLPLLQPENINDAFSEVVKASSRPDFLVVVSYGQILREPILAFPTVAPVNVHASLLPKYRGASPLQNALLNGDTETGVTIQKMEKALDAGPILAQERMEIDPRETFQSLHDKLATAGASLLKQTLLSPLQPKEQREEDATFCRKLTRDDGVADPSTMDAATIDRMVRALHPWPGVRIGENKILSTSLVQQPESMQVLCKGNTTLYVLSIQPPSKKPMSGTAYERGYSLRKQ